MYKITYIPYLILIPTPTKQKSSLLPREREIAARENFVPKNARKRGKATLLITETVGITYIIR